MPRVGLTSAPSTAIPDNRLRFFFILYASGNSKKTKLILLLFFCCMFLCRSKTVKAISVCSPKIHFKADRSVDCRVSWTECLPSRAFGARYEPFCVFTVNFNVVFCVFAQKTKSEEFEIWIFLLLRLLNSIRNLGSCSDAPDDKMRNKKSGDEWSVHCCDELPSSSKQLHYQQTPRLFLMNIYHSFWMRFEHDPFRREGHAQRSAKTTSAPAKRQKWKKNRVLMWSAPKCRDIFDTYEFLWSGHSGIAVPLQRKRSFSTNRLRFRPDFFAQ